MDSNILWKVLNFGVVKGNRESRYIKVPHQFAAVAEASRILV